MKRVLKGLILGFVILFFILFLGLLLVDRRYFEGYIETWVVAKARERNLNIALNHLNLQFTGIHADSLNVFLRMPPLALTIDHPLLYLKPLSVFTLSPTLGIQGKFYGGSAEAVGTISLIDRKADGYIIGKDILISEHPQLAFLSLKGGSLDFNLANLSIVDEKAVKANGTLRITNLSKPRPTTLPKMIVGTSSDITIPEFSDLFVNLAFELESTVLKINEIRSYSSLCNLRGKGMFLPDEVNRAYLVDGYIEVQIKPNGISFFGPWLPIISKNRLAAETKTFRIDAKGPISDPVLGFRTL